MTFFQKINVVLEKVWFKIQFTTLFTSINREIEKTRDKGDSFGALVPDLSKALTLFCMIY